MPKTRYMAILHGDGKIRMESVPMPELQDHEVMIRVHSSLVSPGTEMVPVRACRRTSDPDFKPRPFGYACAGVRATGLPLWEAEQNMQTGSMFR